MSKKNNSSIAINRNTIIVEIINILLYYLSASFAAKAHAAITNKILKTAEPTIVPIPTSLWAINTPIMLVKSSGADPPAAINVAPATSGLIPSYVKEINSNN